MILIDEEWYEESYLETRNSRFLDNFIETHIPNDGSVKRKGGFIPVLFNPEIQELHLEEFTKKGILYTNSVLTIAHGTIGYRWRRKATVYYLFQESLWVNNAWYIYSLTPVKEVFHD